MSLSSFPIFRYSDITWSGCGFTNEIPLFLLNLINLSCFVILQFFLLILIAVLTYRHLLVKREF